MDGQPYGWDPVLLSTSSIYNGKVTYDSAYRASEKAPSQYFDVRLVHFLSLSLSLSLALSRFFALFRFLALSRVRARARFPSVTKAPSQYFDAAFDLSRSLSRFLTSLHSLSLSLSLSTPYDSACLSYGVGKDAQPVF